MIEHFNTFPHCITRKKLIINNHSKVNKWNLLSKYFILFGMKSLTLFHCIFNWLVGNKCWRHKTIEQLEGSGKKLLATSQQSFMLHLLILKPSVCIKSMIFSWKL